MSPNSLLCESKYFYREAFKGDLLVILHPTGVSASELFRKEKYVVFSRCSPRRDCGGTGAEAPKILSKDKQGKLKSRIVTFKNMRSLAYF